jgi:hypothetical protein
MVIHFSHDIDQNSDKDQASSSRKETTRMQDHTAEAPPKTLSVPEAGRRYFDLARNASYDAAKRGDLPTIKIGGKLRVPVIVLERMLEQAGKGT